MSRPHTIPAIQCETYHPYRDNGRRLVYQNYYSVKACHAEVPGTEYLDLKVQLRNRLNTRLSDMPFGFPFHHTHDGHGSSCLSYDSFEFKEDLSGPSRRPNSRNQCATIAFKNASSRDKCQYFTWQAYLPSPESIPLRNAHNVYPPAAHVQVDPVISRTPFWLSLVNDPSVIMRALAISLELEASITIELLDSRSCDAVVYNATYKDGRKEACCIVRT